MSESLPRGVRRHAASALQRAHKKKNLRLGSHRTLTSEKTGETLYQVFGYDPGKGNDAPVSVLLDAEGAETTAKAHGVSATLGTPLASHATLDPSLVNPVATAAASITISPTINDLELDPGETFEETITVTIPPDSGVDKADVYFLADTTGSMTSVINAVKAGASNILASLGMLSLDLAFGVGQYKDFPNDPFAFQHQQSLTTVEADATAAINAWSASGGSDTPEGQLFALDQLAEPSNAATIGWRTNAKKIIVWFGDAPGHDPVCQAISGLGYDITEASATAKLVSESITVLAIGTTTGVPDALDGDPTVGNDYVPDCGPPGGSPDQATRIAAATGGTYSSGIDETTIVNEIIALVTTAASQINNLSLVPTGATAPCVVSIDPAGGYGPLAGNVGHTLDFSVRFRGCKPCGPEPQRFTGTIDAVADGVVVARKRVIITVPPCEPEAFFSYSVKYVCGVQHPDEREACRPAVVPGMYATDINIHNPDPRRRAVIRKHVIPLVYSGKPIGREPEISRIRARDKIVLPPNTATMDDCCRIGELLFDGGHPSPMPLQVGFLQIISNVELEVVAVYTANDARKESITIDVERVPARRYAAGREIGPHTEPPSPEPKG